MIHLNIFYTLTEMSQSKGVGLSVFDNIEILHFLQMTGPRHNLSGTWWMRTPLTMLNLSRRPNAETYIQLQQE